MLRALMWIDFTVGTLLGLLAIAMAVATLAASRSAPLPGSEYGLLGAVVVALVAQIFLFASFAIWKRYPRAWMYSLPLAILGGLFAYAVAVG
jgi:hypothetical protein